MDVDVIRKRFPALSRTQDDKTVAYLDGPAGTQVPASVIDAIAATMTEGYSNLGASNAASEFSQAIVDNARSAMADFYNASQHEIVFGQSMTSHTFAISRALATTWEPGDEIVLTKLDHDANISPWLRVAEERQVTVRWVDFDDYLLKPDAFERVLGPRTRLVAVTAASNALGTVVDIPAICRRVRNSPALLYVDAVHYAPHRLIDASGWDADFVVASAYKFYGPHVGIMYGKSQHLEALPAYKVRPAPKKGPGRWESGTTSFEMLAGVTAAVDYLASHGSGRTRREQLESAYETVADYEARLSDRFLAGVSELDHVQMFGLVDGNRTSTFSVAVEGWSDANAAAELGKRGIYVSNGTYYAVEALQQLGHAGLVRIGFVHYNTEAEVDAVLSALDDLG